MQVWQIPYPRNRVFTGRDDLLDTLARVLVIEHSAALAQPQAISGLGGIGKTQLAVEYAYRFAHRYQMVFWVSAETQESLVSGYVVLAEALNLREKDEQDQRLIINAVRQYLQSHRDWLLILDNADDLSLVQPLLPPVFSGHIVLTTRAQATGRFAQRIEIETLERDDAALLLLRRAGVLSAQESLESAAERDVKIAREISRELGELPLALDQAGAYIEETGCGLIGYRQHYQARRAALLQRRGALATDHPGSVATTWSLSFEKVKQTNPVAAELLKFCSFLAPDVIPEELLVQAIAGFESRNIQDFPEEELSWKINEAVMALRTYSLIQRKIEEKTFSIHRLVQAVLRDAMDEQERMTLLTHVIYAMEALFPKVEFRTWGQCERYLPQALACAEWIVQKSLTLSRGASLLYRTGLYLANRAQYAEAEPLMKCSLAISEQELGATHSTTARNLNNLGELYRVQGKYAEAEPLYQRALAIKERKLGAMHPDTATSLNNLALLYHAQERYAEAEPLYQRALAIRKQELEAMHPDTAGSLNNLAELYKAQGRYKEAEPLYQRALAIVEPILGREHPLTQTVRNNYTSLLRTMDTP